MSSPLDTQVGGDHYKQFVIQPAEYCYKNKLNNLVSEVISYVSRYPFKWKGNKAKQLEDINKAIHSLEILRELVQNEDVGFSDDLRGPDLPRADGSDNGLGPTTEPRMPRASTDFTIGA